MTAPDRSRTALIALLPGDGVGPEVTAAGRAVLEAVAERFGHSFTCIEAPVGGAAIDAAGDPLPPETLALCERADAILLGAVGGPRWDGAGSAPRPEDGLLRLRKSLGLFANLRPVVPSPLSRSAFRPAHLEGVDLLVVRELTGGIYFGKKRCIATPEGETAEDVCTYTSTEVERIVRVAASLARQRRGQLTSVDKANVLETSRLWRRVATRIVAEEFPDVTLRHQLVDSCAMHIVQRPWDYDVIVTENMFGDILTDLAAVLAGSIGLLPSAALAAPGSGASRHGLYEPIHGSAPDIAGRGIANPIGAILSAAMLLRFSLGLEEEAQAIEEAVRQTIAAGGLTADVAETPESGLSTTQVTERVVCFLADAARMPGGGRGGRREHA